MIAPTGDLEAPAFGLAARVVQIDERAALPESPTCVLDEPLDLRLVLWLPHASGVQDESDKDGIRIVVDCRAGEDAKVVLNRLYEFTPLQENFSIISIALVNGRLRTLSLKELLVEFVVYRRIVLPLCTPGLLSAGIFAFTLAQNEFLYALIFLTKSEVRTVPVGAIAELIRGDVFYWGQLMAAALLGSVPVAIIYSFFVEHYVAGLTAGSVKT